MLTPLIFGGIVVSAIGIVFGKRGVYVAAALFLATLVAVPIGFVAVLRYDSARMHALELERQRCADSRGFVRDSCLNAR